MGLALLVNDALIVLREQEKGAEVLVGDLGGKVVQPVAFCRREKADGHGGLLSANNPFLTSLHRPLRGGPVARVRFAVCRLIKQPLTNVCRAWHDESA
jgi:hypothetical protein